MYQPGDNRQQQAATDACRCLVPSQGPFSPPRLGGRQCRCREPEGIEGKLCCGGVGAAASRVEFPAFGGAVHDAKQRACDAFGLRVGNMTAVREPSEGTLPLHPASQLKKPSFQCSCGCIKGEGFCTSWRVACKSRRPAGGPGFARIALRVVVLAAGDLAWRSFLLR